jgi:serine/threonine protein kinase
MNTFLSTLSNAEKDFCARIETEFTPKRLLGEGVYGKAWEGYFRDSQKSYAVKLQKLRERSKYVSSVPYDNEYKMRYKKIKSDNEYLVVDDDEIVNELIDVGFNRFPLVNGTFHLYRPYPNARVFNDNKNSEALIGKYINDISLMKLEEDGVTVDDSVDFSSALIPLYNFGFCAFDPKVDKSIGYYSMMPMFRDGDFENVIQNLKKDLDGDNELFAYNMDFIMITVIHALALIQNKFLIQHNDIKMNNIVFDRNDNQTLPAQLTIKYVSGNGQQIVHGFDSNKIKYIPGIIDWGLSSMYSPDQQIITEYSITNDEETFTARSFHSAADMTMLLSALFLKYLHVLDEYIEDPRKFNVNRISRTITNEVTLALGEYLFDIDLTTGKISPTWDVYFSSIERVQYKIIVENKRGLERKYQRALAIMLFMKATRKHKPDVAFYNCSILSKHNKNPIEFLDSIGDMYRVDPTIPETCIANISSYQQPLVCQNEISYTPSVEDVSPIEFYKREYDFDLTNMKDLNIQMIRIVVEWLKDVTRKIVIHDETAREYGYIWLIASIYTFIHSIVNKIVEQRSKIQLLGISCLQLYSNISFDESSLWTDRSSDVAAITHTRSAIIDLLSSDAQTCPTIFDFIDIESYSLENVNNMCQNIAIDISEEKSNNMYDFLNTPPSEMLQKYQKYMKM